MPYPRHRSPPAAVHILPLLRLLLLLLLFETAAYSLSIQNIDNGSAQPQPSGSCPCSDTSLCAPVQIVHEREVFGFAVSRDTPYDKYDWSQLTTAAWNDDPALMCAAHAAGARVVLDGRGGSSPAIYGNATARAAWVHGKVQEAKDKHLDGINFDMEDALQAGDKMALEYTALVAEAAQAFHAAIPGSQISVDVPWSPYGIDGRSYDWVGLAAAADLLFVMAYDMQSQIWGRCVASANSPLALVRRGLLQWRDEVGVPPAKLVLGLPWYGYRYPCANPEYGSGGTDLCELPAVEFRGAPCSDAAGRQFCYSDIRRMTRRRGSFNGSSGMGSSTGPGGGEGGETEAGGTQGREGAVDDSDSGGWPASRDGGEREQEEVVACEDPREDEVQGGSMYARCGAVEPSPGGGPPTRQSFQMWYDGPGSLSRKYRLAADLGLRGVGFWNLDCLDYTGGSPEAVRDTMQMWEAVHAFTDALGSDGGGQRSARGVQGDIIGAQGGVAEIGDGHW